jgi:hypothetical protein
MNDDTLWPHAGSSRFVAVGSTETVSTGQIGFGLLTSYVSRPVVLRIPSPGPAAGGAMQYAVDDQVNGTFLWSYGVTGRLELDLALPLTFGQGGTGLAPVTGGPGLKDTAVRDMRFGVALVFVEHARPRISAADGSVQASPRSWGLVGRLEMSAPTGDTSEFAGERSGVFVPSVAADYRLGRFFAGAEVGARLRSTTELLGAHIGTQLVAALGAGVDILPRELLSAAVEAWVLPTFEEQSTVNIVRGAYADIGSRGRIAPAEWHVSVRSAPLRSGDLSIELGGGTGIPFGGDLPITTPRFRFTLGLRWAPHASHPASAVDVLQKNH